MNWYNARKKAEAETRRRRYEGLRERGWTLERIARDEGISKQRVWKILAKPNGA